MSSEQVEHLLGADPPVEVGVCLPSDFLHSVKVLGTGAPSRHAKLLVGRPELSAFELTTPVSVIFVEDSMNLLLELLLVMGLPNTTSVAEMHDWDGVLHTMNCGGVMHHAEKIINQDILALVI